MKMNCNRFVQERLIDVRLVNNDRQMMNSKEKEKRTACFLIIGVFN